MLQPRVASNPSGTGSRTGVVPLPCVRAGEGWLLGVAVGATASADGGESRSEQDRGDHPLHHARCRAVLQAQPDRSTSQVDGGWLVESSENKGCCYREGAASPHLEVLSGRFLPLFHPGIGCSVCGVGSRQEMVFSPARGR